MKISDVTVLEGGLGIETPVLVIDALTVSRALDEGEAAELLQQGLNALGLSGKRVVVLQVDE